MALQDRRAVTLLTAADRDQADGEVSTGLPSDLLGLSARRLQVLALLYALIFFLAGIFPALILPGDRAQFLGNVVQWAPGVIGIVVAALLAVVIRRVPPRRAMTLGLMFEIVSSYAIAAAEFGDPTGLEVHQGYMGLSWVAVWVVLFTIVVPTSPRRALIAALASLSSVAVVVGSLIATGATTLRVPPALFFFGLIFPYLLVAGMAWVGSRVVYQLGTEVRRARELGSYQLEEKLGEGGMGEVWRARHRMLARPAAIKLIRASSAGASDQAARRFEREAQVIARLRSPHTVELFDFGIAADGSFYYAMELLEGLDAESLVRRFGPLPPERVISLLRQVCHSLSEAHATGVVHRDIKPANVFLCRYGEEFDFVKVLDFGIVRAARDAVEAGGLETREDRIEGTPAFMAPEQAMGGPVDRRADIYATGCLAYWLLTGELVFTAENPIALIMRHANAPPEPPSSRDVAAIPRALDDLVLACLAKDPAHRPQSARELAVRLAEVGGPVEWTQERAREWWAERMEPALA
ncbi:MAG: protein kinase domain-containing protein [Gemmatimonadales bacterium]